MEELKILVEKLRVIEQEQNKKMLFMKDHNFTREMHYIGDKIKIIKEIRLELQSVAEGRTKTIDANFKYVIE